MSETRTWGVVTWMVVGFQIAVTVAHLLRHNWLEACGTLALAIALAGWRVETVWHAETKRQLEARL